MDEIKALALACISRLGSKSPASEFASNTYLLKDLADILAKPEPTHIFVCDEYDTENSVIFDISKNVWMPVKETGKAHQDHHLAHVERIVLVEDLVFAIGRRSTGHTNSMIAYSISENKWKEMPPMFTWRYKMGVGVVGHRIFVFGGMDDHYKLLDTCEVFDVATGIWQKDTVAPMLTARHDMGIAVVGDLVFVIGGWIYGAGSFATVEVLDTKVNTWKTLSPMPAARCGMGVAVIDDRFIWTFGGNNSRQKFDVIEIFDIENNVWSTPPTRLMSPRYGATAVTVDHKIFVICDRIGYGPTNLVEIIDTDTLIWTTAAPMPKNNPTAGALALYQPR